ncbi:capsule assembly Wzi family protein [Fodinibius sp. AD559]|uniref:capsule assembly Wzi family protein n=1 Tax=Fodinibius sp. AD559 TaxID=3424179 RepID=UPI004046C8E1
MKDYLLSLVPVLAFLLLGLFQPQRTNGQDKNFNYSFESQFFAGTKDELPFWLHTNKNGIVDQNSPNFINSLSIESDIYEKGSLTVTANSDVVFRLSEQESIHFTELNLYTEYRDFYLTIGRMHQPIGLNNHDISVGSMMVSNNATPIPRVAVGNHSFSDVPFTDGIVQYKGLYSHGWFRDDRYVDNPYLHQKYLYLNINIEKFSGTGGIIHNAFWGGEHPSYGRLPQSFNDYIRVVTAVGADEDSNAPGGEVSNVIGNSLAAYEFKAEYDFKRFEVSATRLFYLEDGVSRRFRSPWDGTWSLNIIMDDPSSFISGFTYEHINTKQQDAKPGQEIGRASYYNHFIYRSGWAHYEQILGLPLFNYNTETNRIDNNIIIGHHIGMKGNLTENIKYKLLGTYTRNYGTGVGKAPRGIIDFEERREDQYSFLMETEYQLSANENIQILFSAAIDTGTFRSESLGAMLGIRWKNALSF